MDENGKVVATGIWLYDGSVPRQIEVYARPAEFARSRYKDASNDEEIYDPQIDESIPIPETPDGLVYYVRLTSESEFKSLVEAMSWADSQPWGPVKWTIHSAKSLWKFWK